MAYQGNNNQGYPYQRVSLLCYHQGFAVDNITANARSLSTCNPRLSSPRSTATPDHPAIRTDGVLSEHRRSQSTTATALGVSARFLAAEAELCASWASDARSQRDPRVPAFLSTRSDTAATRSSPSPPLSFPANLRPFLPSRHPKRQHPSVRPLGPGTTNHNPTTRRTRNVHARSTNDLPASLTSTQQRLPVRRWTSTTVLRPPGARVLAFPLLLRRSRRRNARLVYPYGGRYRAAPDADPIHR